MPDHQTLLNRILSNPLLLTATVLIIIGIIIAALFAMTTQPKLEDGSTVTVRIDRKKIAAKVAKSPETQQKGLGGTTGLTDDEGMLFVYDASLVPTFYMKDMNYPIDMIWIAGDTVTEVTPNVQPQPGVSEDQLTRYSPSGPVNRVLEARAGFATDNSIQPGDPVRISSF